MKEIVAKYKYYLTSVCLVVVVLFIWEMTADILHLISPMMSPSPAKIFYTFVYKLAGGVDPDGVTLPQHIVASMKIVPGGYIVGAMIGAPLGIITAWNRKLGMFVKLLFDVIWPIPVLAWIPLMILWLGISHWSRAGIISFVVFTSATTNSHMGIKRTTQVHLRVARILGASNRQTLFKVAIPTVLPMIFMGLRLALGSSQVALAATEPLAAIRGLDYMVQIARMFGRSDVILVGMVTIGVVGYLSSAVLEKLQNKYVEGGR